MIDYMASYTREALHILPPLHELEAEVMEEEWEHHQASVRDVMEALNTRTGKKRAYTTLALNGAEGLLLALASVGAAVVAIAVKASWRQRRAYRCCRPPSELGGPDRGDPAAGGRSAGGHGQAQGDQEQGAARQRQ